MKRCFFLIVLVFVISCDRDKSVNNSNPYLQNVSFVKELNTSFPSYSGLQFPSNPVLITDAGAGIKGIVVMKVGADSYRAYEASCPNHYPSACSLMEIDGINVKCPCENYEYSLYTGLGNAQYPLKEYRTEANGSIIRVYN
jgi:nitrite reductase/ring-hydroxylating ferredoxin subunit